MCSCERRSMYLDDRKVILMRHYMNHVIALLCFVCFYTLDLQATAEPAAGAATAPNSEQALLNQTLNYARGHQTFQDLYFKQHEADFVRLVKEGQSPKTLFIGCSDSRIVPDLMLNTRPGDLFVVRTAGNFVPPADFQAPDGVAATTQYAIEVLNVPHIVVCGHSHCGAIKGLFQQLDPVQFGILQRWLKFGEEAKKMVMLTAKETTPKEELYALAEKVSVIYQLEHLMTYPFIKKRVDEGKLELHGWYFKIETGELWYYNTEKYQFMPLARNLQPVAQAGK